MVLGSKLVILSFTISSLFICSRIKQNKNNDFGVAKNTVLKVFEFSSSNNYDSLKSIVALFQDKSRESLKNNFDINTIKQICKDEGIPTFSRLSIQPYNGSKSGICIIKFIPKNPDKVETDSITFQFDRFNGLEKVAFIDIDRKIQLLKTENP